MSALSDNQFQKIKIVKLFASSEYKTRNTAYKSIVKLLKWKFGNGKRQLNAKEIIAIWKGLFMWLWMQDKPILHEEVVEKITKLFHEIDDNDMALEFIRAFFITMKREWTKIDVHRMDKYYMLVRDVFSESLKWAMKHEQHMDQYIEIVKQAVFTNFNLSSNGFILHLLDILIDELVKIKGSSHLVTQFVTMVILSLENSDFYNICLPKIKIRIIDRLEPLASRRKLKINFKDIGDRLMQNKSAEKALKRKAAKFLSRLGDKFQRLENSFDNPEKSQNLDLQDKEIQSNPNENNNVNSDKEVMDISDSFDKKEDDITDPFDKKEDDLMENECESQTAMETEEVVEDKTPIIIPEDSTDCHEKKEKSVKKSMLNRKSSQRSSDGEDRRVTFGKRFTKTFKKSSTNIRLSLGSVTQHEIKSILKK